MIYYDLRKRDVINTIEQFGRNAGKIWQALSTEGELTKKELQDQILLRDYEINIGIGWLARENKIAEKDGKFMLSETNLTETIGTSAGKIYQVLSEKKELDVKSLQRSTALSDPLFYQAIGWLSKEDKIQLQLNNP